MKKFVAEADSLHERMLASFKEDEEKKFKSKIAALSHSQLDELVVGLRQRAPNAAEAVAYCRMLFATERTREMGLVLCVQLFQGGHFSERAAFRCMPEVRAAIEDSCSVRARVVGGDEHVTGLLARLCDALIGFLSIDSRVGASSLEGYAQALELLPTVLQCLDNLAIKPNTCVPRGPSARQREAELQETEEANKTSASAVRASAVDSILSSTWPPELVLAIQLVLVEVCLSKEEQARACTHIDGDGLQVPEEHVIGLVQSSLAMAEKCGDVRWLDASRRVLEMTPEHMLGDAYCVVEMSLQSGSRLMGLLLQSFAALTSEDKGSLKPQGRAHGASNLQSLLPSFALTVSDLNLMLVVAQNDLFRDIVMDAMTAALRTKGVRTHGADGESSLRRAKKLLSEVVKGREGGRYCCVLLELGLCLLLDGAQGKSTLTAMSGSSQSTLGQHLLCDLFRWQPHVRAELISTIFNALVEHVHSPKFMATCVQVLENIASSHLLSLREEAATIIQCLSLLWLLPVDAARTLLRTFLTLSRHSPTLSDRLMILFRKELYGSAVPRRCLAVFGVCLMLSQGVLQEEQHQLDALIALKPLFSADPDVRAELYEGIESLLTCSIRQRFGESPICKQAQDLLRDLLIARARLYLVDPGASTSSGKVRAGLADSSELRIERCYELVNAGGNAKRWCLKESLCRLVKCIAAMASTDEQARIVMRILAQQLSTPSSVALLLTGEVPESQEQASIHNSRGSQGHAASCSGGPVPFQAQQGPGHAHPEACKASCDVKKPELEPSDRLNVLLPLYEMFIELSACDCPPEWAAPCNDALVGRLHVDKCTMNGKSTLGNDARVGRLNVDKSAMEGKCTRGDGSMHGHLTPLQAWMRIYSSVCSLPQSCSSPKNAAHASSGSFAGDVGKALTALEHIFAGPERSFLEMPDSSASLSSYHAGSESSFVSGPSRSSGSSCPTHGGASSPDVMRQHPESIGNSSSALAGRSFTDNASESRISGPAAGHDVKPSSNACDADSRTRCLQQCPVICRLLERVLQYSAGRDNLQGTLGGVRECEENIGATSSRAAEGGQAAHKDRAAHSSGLLPFVVRLYSITHPPVVGVHARASAPVTRSTGSLRETRKSCETESEATGKPAFISILGEACQEKLSRTRSGRRRKVVVETAFGKEGKEAGALEVNGRKHMAGPTANEEAVGVAAGQEMCTVAVEQARRAEVVLHGPGGEGGPGGRDGQVSGGQGLAVVGAAAYVSVGSGEEGPIDVAAVVAEIVDKDVGQSQSNSGAMSFLFEEELDRFLKERKCGGHNGAGPNPVMYHRMRNGLLETMRVCIAQSSDSAGLVDLLLPENVDSSTRSDGGRRSRAFQGVEYLVARLTAEAEEGIPLATLNAYLDLIQAIVEVEHDRRKGVEVGLDGADGVREGVGRGLLAMLCRFDISHAQVLRRVLTLSIKTLHPLRAASLCARVLSYACTFFKDGMDLGDEPVHAENPLSHLLPPQSDWELPDLDSAATRSCAARVSLCQLSEFFTSPVPMQGPDSQSHISVALHATALAADAYEVAGVVPAAVRALLTRLCRRVLSSACGALSALSHDGELPQSNLHCVLLFARHALAGADSLCKALAQGQGAVGAAQVRHSAYKCGMLVVSAIASLPRGGCLGELAKELEEHVKALDQGDGREDIVIEDVGSKVVSKGGGKRRKRLRSRNAFVDAGLEDEDGSDDYADLEDFIVCKDGKMY